MYVLCGEVGVQLKSRGAQLTPAPCYICPCSIYLTGAPAFPAVSAVANMAAHGTPPGVHLPGLSMFAAATMFA